MDAELQSHIAFHLTGQRPAGGLEPIAEQNLRPALMAHYRDLSALRHDYPVVLVADATPEACVQSLGALIDGIAAKLSIDPEPERTASHLRRLEREIRAAVAASQAGTLSVLWDAATAKLTAAGDDPALADSLLRGRTVLAVDGDVVDCDAALPERFVTHMWRAVEAVRARRFRAIVGGLIARLADVLRADFSLSPQGRSPARLREGMANAFASELDFDALSELLSRAAAKTLAPEARLARVREVLSVLERQRFVGFEGLSAPGSQPAQRHSFLFDSGAAALEAYRTRLPEAVELVRAMGIARLELRSEYVPKHHDAFFADFGPQMLGEDDLALFPGYLVCVSATELSHASADLMELLGAGLPVKFLVQLDDVLEPSPIADGRVAFRAGARQLATMALGLNDVYVMQATGSHLFALREQLVAGLSGFGPGLVSVFSGASSATTTGGLPPYLLGAAAVESRAFPLFWYDPSAGTDWATRFSLEDNPQAQADWPAHEMRVEDATHQRATVRIAFTLIDLASLDSRYAAHFARVPGGKWEADLVPVAGALNAVDSEDASRAVPFIQMVDAQGRLHRVIVDEKMMLAARRCLDQWRGLQELGGIRNSYATALLERERAAWEAAQEALGAAALAADAPRVSAADAAPAAAKPAAAAVAAPEAVEERAPGEAYIETARCSSCDECTTISKKIFAYDENKQAYIVDAKAGTYRQMVEAAESCQVSIIHPGLPLNPDEPGLEELIERAALFQ